MIRIMLFCLLFSVCSVTYARVWGVLTISQKELLTEYRSVWHLLLPSQQKILEAGAFRVSKANSESLIFFQAEYEKWLNLSPEARRELEKRWGLFKELPRAERQRIKIGLAHLKKLPREKQESIRYLLREAEDR